MNEIENLLETRREYLKEFLNQINSDLQQAPESRLRISFSHGRTQYYRVEKGESNGKYLSKEKVSTARDLAQKDYNEKLQKAITKELKAIDNYLKDKPSILPEEIYSRLSERRQDLIKPAFETDEMFVQRWSSVEYNRKSFDPGFPEYYTARGERVRSKSEVIIADLLLRENIPYRYEYPIQLKGLGWIHPDFTVLNVRERKEYIWEHLGQMDKQSYAEDSVKRMRYYQRNGYFPGKNMILTYETNSLPVNIKDLKLFIDEYLR